MSDAEAHRQADELYQTGKIGEKAAASAARDPYRLEVLQQLTAIKTCLVGDDLGTTGLVKRMSNIEDRVAKAEDSIKAHRVIWKVIAFLSASWGAWWAGHK